MKSLSPSSIGFTLLIAGLAGLPPLSTDMSLPGLPAMQTALAASSTESAMVLSLFFAGFGAAQLALGPLSDRIGRRPVLLASMVIYTLAGFGCGMAPSIFVLLACRLVQGLGAAGGTVLAFAIVRDVYSGNEARARLSSISMVFSLAPVIAPSIGTVALLLGGWRASYWMLGLAGLILTTAAATRLAETRVVRVAQSGLYGPVLRQRHTLGYALVNAMGSGSTLAFVTGSPLVLLGSMGLSAPEFAGVFAMVSIGIMCGATANRLLVSRGVRAVWPLAFGLSAAVLGGLGLCVLALLGKMTLPLMVPLLFVNTFCRGMISPNATHAALERLPERAGAVSALMGSLQMLMGSLSGVLVGLMFPALGPAAMAVAMTGFAILALMIWLITERRS